MLQGLLVLLGRSLRLDSRSWLVHLARLGLMLAIYLSLVYVFSTSARFGAPGLRYFRAIVWLNAIFMTLLGISFFSTAISEEKEEDTLGLMQMAGINPLALLLGKTGGRLVQALLLIAVQYPFTLLAVTLGGVTTNQVRCVFAGLAALLVLMTGLGLACSTFAPRNRTASTMTVLGLTIYTAVPFAATEVHRTLIANGLLSVSSHWAKSLSEVAAMCFYLQVDTLLTSSFNESPWSTQVISNVIGGGVCFVAAWVFFPMCTRNAAVESASRGLLARRMGRWRWLSPGRPRVNPFFWKDFHFIGGGLAMTLIRCAAYFGLFSICVVLGEFWWGSSGTYLLQRPIGLYQVLLLIFVTLEIAVLAARVVHEEIHGQTLAALVMLPGSLTALMYNKLAGALLSGLSGVICLGIISLCTPAGRHHTYDFLDHSAGWFFLVHFLLVPHLSAALALSMRWGCIPLAIGLSVGSLFGWIAMFEACHISPHHATVSVGTLFVCGLCVGCHYWIMIRLPMAAARG